MTKEQFVYLIFDQLGGGNTTSALLGKFHPTEIEKFIELAYNDVVGKANSQATRYSDNSQLDNYIKAYKFVAVVCDTDLNEYYSTLPAPIIQIPDNQAIRLICPMKDQTDAFVYEDNSSRAIFSELEVNALDSSITYEVEGMQIRYKTGMTKEIADAGVLMKLIVYFDSLEDSDEIFIPAGQSAMVFDLVSKMLFQRKQVPEQTNNDSTSKAV